MKNYFRTILPKTKPLVKLKNERFFKVAICDLKESFINFHIQYPTEKQHYSSPYPSHNNDNAVSNLLCQVRQNKFRSVDNW